MSKSDNIQLALSGSAAIDDGFLGRADPTLIKALLSEIEHELEVREKGERALEDVPEPRPLKREEWPTRDYTLVQRWRYRRIADFMKNPDLIVDEYSNDPIRFICHWLDIYEPRNAGKGLPTRMPFLLFQRQAELIQFFHACVLEESNGLVEKSRDMGATWCGVGYSVWMWLFVNGTTIGWGSANANKLDRLGDSNSIFEKIRLTIRGLAEVFKPTGFHENKHLMHMRITNPENGNAIIGDVGDNIGRGGRTSVYFVDEAAYLDHPELVEASLSETTRTRIDISSVSGPGTIFHRTRQSGVVWKPGGKIYKDRANVFLLDWRDHPEKDEEWAAARKAAFEAKGLLHVYAREIERDYAATATGVIIKPEWFDAAINAHKKLDLDFTKGRTTAGLDVADEGAAVNACVVAQHRLVSECQHWGARDTAITARKALIICKPYAPLDLQYDCIGIGAGIKAECNRLKDMGLMPEGINLVPWRAGDNVQDPFERVIKNDDKSPMNRDFFLNLRAQAWWSVSRLFYNTWRMVTQHRVDSEEEEVTFDPSEMIAIDASKIDTGTLHRLRDELIQVTATQATQKLKMAIEKAPDGAPSPNLADALIMALFPMPRVVTGSTSAFVAPRIIRG